VNCSCAAPLLFAVPDMLATVEPSPQVSVPLTESPAGAVQESVAFTLCPVVALVGEALSVQLGGGGVVPALTVTATGEPDTVPDNPLVLSLMVAETE
jgi:hypothetical protein